MESLVSREQVERWDRSACEALVLREAMVRYCPRCTEPLTGGCASTQMWTCPGCEFVFCSACMRPAKAHGRKGQCEKFRLFLSQAEAQERLFEEFKEKEARSGAYVVSCPGCQAFFQKTNGCNHITCPCGKEFCYLCGASYYDENGECHFNVSSICNGGMTMDEYRERVGLQTNRVPLEAPPPPPLSAAQLRRIQVKRRKTVALALTAPLWVPALPLLLAGYGAYWVGDKAYTAHKDHQRAKERERLRQAREAARVRKVQEDQARAEESERQREARKLAEEEMKFKEDQARHAEAMTLHSESMARVEESAMVEVF